MRPALVCNPQHSLQVLRRLTRMRFACRQDAAAEIEPRRLLQPRIMSLADAARGRSAGNHTPVAQPHEQLLDPSPSLPDDSSPERGSPVAGTLSTPEFQPSNLSASIGADEGVPPLNLKALAGIGGGDRMSPRSPTSSTSPVQGFGATIRKSMLSRSALTSMPAHFFLRTIPDSCTPMQAHSLEAVSNIAGPSVHVPGPPPHVTKV